MEANFCHLKAFGPSIKITFWDHWETALFGPNPGQEPFGSKFLPFAGSAGSRGPGLLGSAGSPVWVELGVLQAVHDPAP